MDVITSSKEKEKIKPYRKYQLAILLFLTTFIAMLFLIFSCNKELRALLLQNNSLSDQLFNKELELSFHQLIFSKLEVNYVSLNKLETNYTSDIIHTLEEFHTMLSWTEDVENTETSFYMCYKASIHGDTAEAYHKECDGSSPLLFLIETAEGYRFGAYITETTIKRIGHVYDTHAFLFSFDTGKKYEIAMPEVAFQDLEKGFPSFGNNDIFIVEGFLNHSKNICMFPQAYVKDQDLVGDYPLTGGLRNFKIKDMEVLILFSHYSE